MEKVAFVLQLKPGHEAEYKRRHDVIWPELQEELKASGIVDYSIFLHPDTLQLFGFITRETNHSMDELPTKPIMKKWWDYMADIMDTNEDNSPTSIQLIKVFQL
jgi:L-rhamnose mutarotase